MDIKKIEELIRLVNGSGLAEFELEQDDMKIKLVNQQKVVEVAMPTVAAGVPSAPLAAPVEEGSFVYVTSPLVGIFKSLSATDKTPIKVGDVLNIGQAVCVVEAMKLINEIESDKAGEVVEIMVSEGDSVEFGQELIKLKIHNS